MNKLILVTLSLLMTFSIYSVETKQAQPEGYGESTKDCPGQEYDKDCKCINDGSASESKTSSDGATLDGAEDLTK